VPGPTGPGVGATGATGVPGTSGALTVIPFSSGTPVAIGSVLDDDELVESCALVAFGDSVPDVTILGGAIDLNSLLDPLVLDAVLEMAWVMPRDGTLESLAGFYTNLLGVTLLVGTANVTLQIFRRPATDAANTNVFTAYGPQLTLTPSFGGVLALSQTASGNVGLGSLPVLTGDSLVLVACADRQGGLPNLATILTGYIRAGLSIA